MRWNVYKSGNSSPAVVSDVELKLSQHECWDGNAFHHRLRTRQLKVVEIKALGVYAAARMPRAGFCVLEEPQRHRIGHMKMCRHICLP